MRLIAVNVGRPKQVAWNNKTVLTSIYKDPVNGPVQVAKLNLDGDQQSDLTVHGGVDKAVYVYPLEHYPFWRDQYPNLNLSFGALGENFTTEGFLEPSTNIGDRFRVGSAEFIVRQPRIPCFKLGIKFGDPKIIKTFLHSNRPGFYLAVTKEGEVSSGDSVEWLERDQHNVSVTDVVNLYSGGVTDPELLARAVDHPALPLSWRDHFRSRQ
jgi:MOSC domain-containing protein YiiM